MVKNRVPYAQLSFYFLFWPENDSKCAHLWTKFIFTVDYHVCIRLFVLLINNTFDNPFKLMNTDP